MSEIPTDLIKGLNVAERIGSSVYDHIKENRAYAQTVAVELRQNIELIELYQQAGVKPKDIIPQLSNAALLAALNAGFNFASLKRSKIGPKSTRKIPQLEKYIGWTTQKSFKRLCTRISTLKEIQKLPKKNRDKLRPGARLNNLFRFLIMLGLHIGA